MNTAADTHPVLVTWQPENEYVLQLKDFGGRPKLNLARAKWMIKPLRKQINSLL